MNVCYWKTFLNEKQYSFLPPLEVLWNNAVCVRERESWITFWLENIHQFRFSMGHMDWWFSLDLMVNVYIYILELPPLYFLKWPGFRKNLYSFNFEAKCSLYKIVLFVCVVGRGVCFSSLNLARVVTADILLIFCYSQPNFDAEFSPH